MSYRHSAPQQLAPTCRAALAIATLAIVGAMAAVTTSPANAQGSESAAAAVPGYWLSCSRQGDNALAEGDLTAAATLLERACDLAPINMICDKAKDAQQQAEAAGRR